MTTLAYPRLFAGPSDPPAEADLPARALAGDASAWNALVRRHNHRVVVALLGRGFGIDRAKDIAQEAWVRLIEQQRAGKLSELRLPALAVAQATFLALDDARREGRTRGLEEGQEFVDPQPLSEERVIGEQRLALAEKTLARCSPMARRVFTLVYGGGGLSHADVAAQVGLSVQRVRQIVCEVRKELRSVLEEP